MIIKVKVQTKSSKNEVIDLGENELKVKCTTVPEKGKANATVIALLAKHYKIPKSNIILLKGSSNPVKVFEIKGLEL